MYNIMYDRRRAVGRDAQRSLYVHTVYMYYTVVFDRRRPPVRQPPTVVASHRRAAVRLGTGHRRTGRGTTGDGPYGETRGRVCAARPTGADRRRPEPTAAVDAAIRPALPTNRRRARSPAFSLHLFGRGYSLARRRAHTGARTTHALARRSVHYRRTTRRRATARAEPVCGHSGTRGHRLRTRDARRPLARSLVRSSVRRSLVEIILNVYYCTTTKHSNCCLKFFIIIYLLIYFYFYFLFRFTRSEYFNVHPATRFADDAIRSTIHVPI